MTSTNKDGDETGLSVTAGSADWRLIADKLAEALVRAKMYIPLKQRYQAQDHLAARLALEDYQAAIKPNP